MAKSKKSVSSKSGINLIPSAGYILIEPFEAQQKTDSGIYLPDTANPEKPQKGKVLEVGESLVTDFGIKKGSPVNKDEVVYYKKWGGNEVKIEGKEYLFVKFEDILAIEK